MEKGKRKFFLKVRSQKHSYDIRKSDGEYLTLDEANHLIRLVSEESPVYLDKMEMGLFAGFHHVGHPIEVMNELDDDYSPIPLEVKVIKE